jgi:hypothetical protein
VNINKKEIIMKDLSTGLKNILGVGLKPGSYLNILYLLLAFPLGIFYFVYLITGFSIGLGLLYIFIGLPFLLLTMFSWRIFARFEGFQARWLLKEAVQADRPLRWTEANGFWNWITSRLSSKYTWKGLVYLLLKAPLGIVSFIVTATLASVSGVLIIAPFIYRFVDYELPWGAISTMSQALSLTAIGLGLGLFSLHIFNGLAAVFRWLSKSLLNSGQRLAVAE